MVLFVIAIAFIVVILVFVLADIDIIIGIRTGLISTVVIIVAVTSSIISWNYCCLHFWRLNRGVILLIVIAIFIV